MNGESMGVPIPPSVERIARGATARTVGRDKSDARVYRLEREGHALYLKVRPVGPGAPSLFDEASRSTWLASTGLTAPRVVAVETFEGNEFLLTEALAGIAANRALAEHPEWAIDSIARAARQLHSLDPRACPFDAGLERELATAASRVELALVDPADFDIERTGTTPRDLLARAIAGRPTTTDAVVTHGDLCPDNLVVGTDGSVAFLDLGRLGVADRYRDLALITRELDEGVVSDGSGARSTRFLDRYGVGVVDDERLTYYRLLDELF
jgi:aminoglycoside 3'-phosphotransferase-2